MYGNSDEEVNISDLMGKTITQIKGAEKQSGMITFYTSDGYRYDMYHEQDCCESVYVEDITGDIKDIIGEEIVEASEISQDNPHATESGTWTFYKLNSYKGWGGICIRWNGESNGYYSESVNIFKTKIDSKENENE